MKLVDVDVVFSKMESTFDMQDSYLPVQFMDFLINDVLAVKIQQANQDKWISVEDRLPDNMAAVIIAGHKHKENKMIVSQCCAMYYPKDGGKWLWNDDCSEVLYKVTHWMPLPEPPKDGE